MDLCNINEIKALLTRHGFHFSKAKGQNFLTQSWVPQNIVLEAGIDESCGVLEVGPGIGPLTQQLCRHAKKVVAVEIDRNLIPILKETLADYNNVTVINEDILRVDIKALAEEYNGGKPIKVVANLPYYITTPIIMGLFESGVPIDNITVMVQKEVGQRLAAGPGNGHYGALSVWVQSFARPRMEFIVGPGAFSPPPKVDSAVLSFEPLPLDQRPERPDLLALVIKVCFQQRRKQLGSIARRCPLAPWLSAAIEQAGITPTLRPEQLTVADFQHISRFGASLLDNPLKN